MATDDGGASVGGASVAGGGNRGGQGACGSIERRRGRGRRENGVEKPDSLSLSLALHVVLLTLHSISPRPSVAGRQYPIDGNLLTPLCSNLPRLLIHLDIYTCLQSELSQFQCLPVVRFRIHKVARPFVLSIRLVCREKKKVSIVSSAPAVVITHTRDAETRFAELPSCISIRIPANIYPNFWFSTNLNLHPFWQLQVRNLCQLLVLVYTSWPKV